MSGYHKGVIFKLASADGVVVWQTGLPSDPTTEFTTSYDPVDVAVDNAGNAFVTSSMMADDPIGMRTLYIVHTAKFAAADGALRWERRHFRDHTEGLFDFAGGLALDSFNNVVMGGWFSSAIYAATDGAILWESPAVDRHNVPVVYGRSLLATGPNGMIASLGQLGDDIVTSVYQLREGPASFAQWAARFGLAEATPVADPDGDGVPTAVEYVLGGNPSSAAHIGNSVNIVSTQPPILLFLRDDASESRDVTLTVQAGTTLADWPESFIVGSDSASSSPGVSIAENGSEPDTVTITLPTRGGTPQFARLTVTIAP
jgi:hypothetical protein